MELLTKDAIRRDILKLAVGVSVAGLVTKFAWNYLQNYQKNKIIPEKWVNVAKVSKLIIYPVKSCKGVEVESATLTPLGLKASVYLRDRAFAVFDSKATFQSQKQFPKMRLINVDIESDAVTFSAPGVTSLTVHMGKQELKSTKRYRIFQDFIKGIDCGDDIGHWLDTFLSHKGLRLVYDHSNEGQRKVTSKGAFVNKFPNFSVNDLGIFQDDTSYMLMSQESVQLLNTKLEKPVTYKSFRPVILIDGLCEAFSEDSFTFIRFGNKENGPIIKSSIPCYRCRMTTIDLEDGTFSKNGEPLKTLIQIKRKIGDDKVAKLIQKNDAVMGNKCGLYDGADAGIHVGDLVFVAVL